MSGFNCRCEFSWVQNRGMDPLTCSKLTQVSPVSLQSMFWTHGDLGFVSDTTFSSVSAVRGVRTNLNYRGNNGATTSPVHACADNLHWRFSIWLLWQDLIFRGHHTQSTYTCWKHWFCNFAGQERIYQAWHSSILKIIEDVYYKIETPMSYKKRGLYAGYIPLEITRECLSGPRDCTFWRGRYQIVPYLRT